MVSRTAVRDAEIPAVPSFSAFAHGEHRRSFCCSKADTKIHVLPPEVKPVDSFDNTHNRAWRLRDKCQGTVQKHYRC